MNIQNAFPSKYLKASDLKQSPSQSYVLTISHVTMEDVGYGSDKEPKPVVYFNGASKGLVLNVTNGNAIAEIAGTTETDDWTGVEIELHADRTLFGGKKVDCIRVREAPAEVDPEEEPEPAPPPRRRNPKSDDKIPF